MTTKPNTLITETFDDLVAKIKFPVTDSTTRRVSHSHGYDKALQVVRDTLKEIPRNYDSMRNEFFPTEKYEGVMRFRLRSRRRIHGFIAVGDEEVVISSNDRGVLGILNGRIENALEEI